MTSPNPHPSATRRGQTKTHFGTGDEGSFTVFVAVLTVGLFSLIGLVIDGGRAVSAESAATGEAEQAARLGADQISVLGIRSGTVEIEGDTAVRAVDDYLRSVGIVGVVTVTGQAVNVRIQSSEPTVVLGIIGVQRIGISASATATNVHGVTREDG